MIFWNHGKTPPIGKVTSVEMLSEGIIVHVEMEAGMLWRGFNKETGEAVYQDTKARTIAHIFDEVKLKSLCRTLLPMGDNSSSKEKD
jgi:hypothetical protein